MRSRGDCSSYHAGAWALRKISWHLFLAGASSILLAHPADAQTARAESAAGQLPPVTVTSPEATWQRRVRPQQSRRERSVRNPAAVRPPSPPLAATTGVTSGSATSGKPGLQPTAVSETIISGEEMNARPASRIGELLEAVPGLIITQHSGEGKANQYFLRGFNLDHGTDLAITVDGMPVNMPTHGHGQGYADVNFLIPELVGAVNVCKGPYFADKGDFASAGSVDIDYLTKLPKNLAEISFGSFGHLRGVAAGSTAVGAGTLLAVVEGTKYNGPWDVPDNVRKLNGVLRYSQGTASDGFTLSAMGYSNGWNSTDQVARRAIDQNLIGRFGTLDPTDGGTSSRFSLSSNWAHSSEFGQSKANAYVVRSAMQLFNNFTYLLDDPVNGDQFSQLDRRTLYGFNASHSFDVRVAGIETQTRVGLNTRGDDIHVGLFRTMQRTVISTVREDHVREGNLGLWADTTARWTDWLRTTVGLRQDYFAGRVASDTPENSGNASANITSPKAGIVLGPWYRTEFYGNAGYGLHSNDIRGATINVDPNDKVTPQDRVPLLVRSRGAEIGIRTKAIPDLTSSLALFVLDFDSELLFVGDAGTTEPSRPSRRVGVEWTNKYKVQPWMTLDLDVAYTRTRFTDFDSAGDRI
ncbi:MAG: TonB-dependent receptor, partial [Bradyrhizobium sp.]|nr:TonB-dependent receptor [Bradyrhizobium sp.]